jgi:GTP-binding protein LepA
MSSNPSLTRNFCIIAHIDHGKTTLSDRLLEVTGAVQKRDMKEQLLDSMDLERERGITIKSHPVCVHYKHTDDVEYELNLIDTPGHVDFSYEVSRSLAACEGALLLVDAGQGVEAQTVANATLAVNQNLAIIPVINKIDLPGADIEGVRHQIEEILSIPADDAVLASGKTGIGITDILKAIVERVPQPRWADFPQARMLIFDCVYDAFKGVVCYVRVFSGEIRLGDSIMMMHDGKKTEVKEIGRFAPRMTACAPGQGLGPGDVGYITTSIKDLSEVKIGDTITLSVDPAKEALPGYKAVRPMVFAGIYPIDTSDYEKLKVSMAKLRLNDAAFVYTLENSVALGFGFRCGFLGLLHMEIVMERIRREYDLDIISTYPSVVYKVELTDGHMIEVDNPVKMPDPSTIAKIMEPTIEASLHIPTTAIGDVLSLIMEKRGICGRTETIDTHRVILHTTLPLNEILIDFNDRLKSMTKGYGSMDYDLADYVESKLVKMEILVNGDPVDAFASIVHEDKAIGRGRQLCSKLKELLPQSMFKVAIQAAIGARIIARETLSAMRKDVLAKCYGGDITRKRKLLEKQKEGKKRMKQIGKVSIPQEAFVDILKNNT